MFLHIRNIWFCLTVLWQQKKISCSDRLRLWVKSVNLYDCLLGFTDKERPVIQTVKAMICAFLSAVYDYETDWCPVLSASASIFLQLLDLYVDDPVVKQKAAELFIADLNGRLSKDGLERGSGAFRFYCSVINSKWLAEYSSEQLDEFGRLLQQVDDLLDFANDKKRGEANCFAGDRADFYSEEAKAFMKGDFFLELVRHSGIYTLIRWRCEHVCHKLQNTLPGLIQIAKAARPITALYAGAAVFAGFKLETKINWLSAVVAVTFALVTASIMIFNDLMEREHDRIKGKEFCYKYTWLVLSMFVLCCMTICVLVLVMKYLDDIVCLFIIGIWVCGLAYSFRFVRKLYLAQSLVVAVCSASPILCGVFYTKRISLATFLIFCILTALVLMSEFLKDVEDAKSDAGYKETLPARKGSLITVFTVISICYAMAIIWAFVPTNAVRMTGYGLALIVWLAGWSLMRPDRCRYVIYGVDFVICCVLLAILIFP